MIGARLAKSAESAELQPVEEIREEYPLLQANNALITASIQHTAAMSETGWVESIGWKLKLEERPNIKALSSSANHIVGLRRDGTVIARSERLLGNAHCKVEGWSDIVAIAAGGECTVGLRYDGTVVAAGLNRFGECNVNNWSEIIAVATSGRHTIGLKSNGKMVDVGDNRHHECDVFDWKKLRAPL